MISSNIFHFSILNFSTKSVHHLYNQCKQRELVTGHVPASEFNSNIIWFVALIFI